MITRRMRKLVSESPMSAVVSRTKLPNEHRPKRKHSSTDSRLTVEEEPSVPTRKIKIENGVAKKPKTVSRKGVQNADTKGSLIDDHNLANAVSSNVKLVGAHVSVAGGLENAPISAAAMGAKAFGLFLRSQRQWNSKPLEEETIEKFKQECRTHGFSPGAILPHGSYLLNCGAPNPETLRKSRDALMDELQRCEKLGLSLYNFHPGSTCGEISVEQCLDRIGETINLAHANTKYVITVVENMSRQGHTVGGDFKELKGIIDRVKDKSRIGVCIDTCHAFAAGYDLATEQGFMEMMNEFESVIGLKYLKAIHLNDSKGKVGCHLDRHENIGKGHIGREGFQRIMQDSRFDNIPMILETPYDGDHVYEREIKLLFSLI